MFGIGVPELILILALALIVLGPDKLPQVAKQIARFVGELKKASEDFKKQLDVEGLEDIKELREMADLKNPQTWKKNFDRLVDLDSDSKHAHPLAESDDLSENGKSDLPGGLGSEWKVAQGPASPSKPHESSMENVVNPDIDYSVFESSETEKEGAGTAESEKGQASPAVENASRPKE